jgi:hypothetical protein
MGSRISCSAGTAGFLLPGLAGQDVTLAPQIAKRPGHEARKFEQVPHADLGLGRHLHVRRGWLRHPDRHLESTPVFVLENVLGRRALAHLHRLVPLSVTRMKTVPDHHPHSATGLLREVSKVTRRLPAAVRPGPRTRRAGRWPPALSPCLVLIHGHLQSSFGLAHNGVPGLPAGGSGGKCLVIAHECFCGRAGAAMRAPRFPGRSRPIRRPAKGIPSRSSPPRPGGEPPWHGRCMGFRARVCPAGTGTRDPERVVP